MCSGEGGRLNRDAQRGRHVGSDPTSKFSFYIVVGRPRSANMLFCVNRSLVVSFLALFSVFLHEIWVAISAVIYAINKFSVASNKSWPEVHGAIVGDRPLPAPREASVENNKSDNIRHVNKFSAWRQVWRWWCARCRLALGWESLFALDACFLRCFEKFSSREN